MSVANIQETILLYTREQDSLTHQLSDIMGRITMATANTTEIMEQTNEKRAYFAQKVSDNPNYADTTQYKVESQAVESDYQLQMAEINSWESQLEQQKNTMETRLKAVTTFLENWSTLLKNNIKKDFTYGGGGQ